MAFVYFRQKLYNGANLCGLGRRLGVRVYILTRFCYCSDSWSLSTHLIVSVHEGKIRWRSRWIIRRIKEALEEKEVSMMVKISIVKIILREREEGFEQWIYARATSLDTNIINNTGVGPYVNKVNFFALLFSFNFLFNFYLYYFVLLFSICADGNCRLYTHIYIHLYLYTCVYIYTRPLFYNCPRSYTFPFILSLYDMGCSYTYKCLCTFTEIYICVRIDLLTCVRREQYDASYKVCAGRLSRPRWNRCHCI